MSARSPEYAKTEIKMGLLILVAVVLLALPTALSLFRDTTAIEYLIKSVPFALNLMAVCCIAWAVKRTS